MLYKIRCNMMHPLYGALPDAVLLSHIGIGTYMPPRYRTLHYRWTFSPLSVSLWNDLADTVFDGVGLLAFKRRVNVFLLA